MHSKYLSIIIKYNDKNRELSHDKQVKLRIATVRDSAALLDIYAPYVENTAITFEYTVPSVREFEHRISNTLRTYPYLVAEMDNEIVGYTYASPFRERCAYQWAVEVSIYVKKSAKKMGIGNKLYQTLEIILSLQNITICMPVLLTQLKKTFISQKTVFYFINVLAIVK